MHCIFFGCRGEHINDHLKKNNHYIAMELAHGMLYCFNCKDYIYHDECQKIAQKNRDKEARLVIGN